MAYRSTDHWVTVNQDGGIILMATGGTPYGADEAGAAAPRSATVMNEWHVEDEAGSRLILRVLADRASYSAL